MPGIRILIPSSGPGTGPILPTPLHSAGISNPTRRWVASRVEGASGSPVTSWADTVNPAKIITGTSAFVDVQGGRRYVRLDNVAGAALTFPDSMSVPLGIAVVVRGGTADFLRAAGLVVGRQGNGSARLSGEGISGAGLVISGSNSPADVLSVVQISYDTAAKFRWNAAVGAISTATPVPGTPTANGITWSNLAAADLLIAEIITRATAFSDAELTSIYEAMKAHYTDIP